MADQPSPPTLSFHYIKSHHFRVVHADGIIGGPTPRGLLHFAIYSERQSIPQLIVQNITMSADGKQARLGDEVERIGKDGVTRELEVDLVMDRKTAAELHKWLGQRLAELPPGEGQ